MEQSHDTLSEVTYHHEPSSSTKRIWRTFWLLLGITVVELLLGLLIHMIDMPAWLILFLKGVIVILTLAKAFYIAGIFMHLGDEIRNFIMTIVVPLFLFIWFIAAFIWDGAAFRANRNRYDTYFKESTMEKPVNSADTARRPFD
jgi:cytochrome c oxidase subunit IV